MTSIKVQAVETLNDIPDDKIDLVIEVLKGLRLLYVSSKESSLKVPLKEEAWYLKKIPEQITDVEQLFGTLPADIDLDEIKSKRFNL